MPSTTSGRTFRITLALCQNASNRRAGSNNQVRTFFPRNPEKRIVSRVCPCCRVSVVSIPPSVPSQTTRQPARFKYAATARPENTCPPVPPAIMRIVWLKTPFLYFSYPITSRQLPVFPIRAQQHRQREAACNYAAATKTHQRQGEPLRREHSHIHAHVDECLHSQPYTDTLRHECGKMTSPDCRLAADH